MGPADAPARRGAALWLLQVPHEGPDRLARLAATLLDADGGRVTVITDEEVVLGHHDARGPAPVALVGVPSLCSWVVSTAAPVVVHDLRDDPRGAELLASGSPIASCLGVPLQAQGHTVGSLAVFGHQPRAWSAHDVQLLQELAVSVSAELQNQVLTAELAEAADRMRVAFDAAGFGSFDWDLTSDEIRADAQYRRMFGLPAVPAPLSFEHVYERVHPQDRQIVGRAVGSAVRSGLYAVDHRIVRPDGAVRWVTARGRVSTEGPSERRLVGAVTDTTDARDVNQLVARELQLSMLTELPQPERLELSAVYLPAAQGHTIGGDWYDAFVLPDGSTTLVIGDVTGHDTRAAATMGALRNVLRGLSYDELQAPSQVLRRLDLTAEGLGMGTSLATLLMARVDRLPAGEGLRLRWSAAGHPPPVLVHPSGSATVLDAEPDLMLGVFPQTPRYDHEHLLARGSTLLLYTDGLVERRGENLSEGIARLCALAQALAGEPLDRLVASVVEGLVAPGADDDTALLAVRVR